MKLALFLVVCFPAPQCALAYTNSCIRVIRVDSVYGWQSRSCRSTHSLTDSSFITWQFWCTVLTAIKKKHAAIQTSKGQLHQQDLCLWEDMVTELLEKFICPPDLDRHIQIKIKYVIITQKLSEWKFTAAWSNQYDCNQWSTQQHCSKSLYFSGCCNLFECDQVSWNSS